jgi:hypothetical protein
MLDEGEMEEFRSEKSVKAGKVRKRAWIIHHASVAIPYLIWNKRVNLVVIELLDKLDLVLQGHSHL